MRARVPCGRRGAVVCGFLQFASQCEPGTHEKGIFPLISAFLGGIIGAYGGRLSLCVEAALQHERAPSSIQFTLPFCRETLKSLKSTCMAELSQMETNHAWITHLAQRAAGPGRACHWFLCLKPAMNLLQNINYIYCYIN